MDVSQPVLQSVAYRYGGIKWKGDFTTLCVLVDMERDLVSSVSKPHLGQGSTWRTGVSRVPTTCTSLYHLILLILHPLPPHVIVTEADLVANGGERPGIHHPARPTLHRRQECCPCRLQLWHFRFSCSTTCRCTGALCTPPPQVHSALHHCRVPGDLAGGLVLELVVLADRLEAETADEEPAALVPHAALALHTLGLPQHARARVLPQALPAGKVPSDIAWFGRVPEKLCCRYLLWQTQASQKSHTAPTIAIPVA